MTRLRTLSAHRHAPFRITYLGQYVVVLYMSGRAAAVAFGSRSFGDEWQRCMEFVVCYSGYFVQATSDAAVSINLMTVESGQGWTNSRMVKMAFGQVLLTSFHPQMS
jgi:hypothetical protein